MQFIGKSSASQSTINSSEKSSHWIFMAFGAVFIAFSAPIFINLSQELYSGNYEILIALIFPLAGFFIAYKGYKQRQTYLFFGPTPLTPSPNIGQIGGQVGGSIDINNPWEQRVLNVHLSCLHIYSTGTGDNKSTHTDIVWLEKSQPYDRPSGSGSRLEFCFDVPDDQPVKGSFNGRGTIHWEVMIDGIIHGRQFQRHWKIPVEKGDSLSSIRIPDVHTQSVKAAQKERAEQSVSDQINTQVTEGGLDILSEQGRNKSMSFGLTLFGLIFLSAGVFLGYQAIEEGVMLWFMSFIFSLVGGGIFLFGLFLIGRKLECKIIGGRVYVRRSVYGFVIYRREGALSKASQFILKSTMSSQQGSKKVEYMAVYANINCDDGTRKELKLVEGIEGKMPGEAMLEKIKNYFNDMV